MVCSTQLWFCCDVFFFFFLKVELTQLLPTYVTQMYQPQFFLLTLTGCSYQLQLGMYVCVLHNILV